MSTQKIAILGGGASALVAAYEITSDPAWRTQFDVTVYQQGHRLGGKGASGRNAAHRQRIEEHGLHIWMGFYENAFRVIRDVYAKNGRPAGAPLAAWTDAFKPHSYIVLEEEIGGVWKSWALDFPPNPDTPGDGATVPTPWEHLAHLVDFMLGAFANVPPDPGSAGGLVQWLDDLALGAEALVRNAVGFALHAAALGAQKIFQLLEWVRTLLGSPPAPHPTPLHGLLVDALRLVVAWAKDGLENVSAVQDDLRRAFLVLDLAGTCAIGLIEEGIIFPPYDFRSIDKYDLKEWLTLHGAHPTTVESSPVNAIYDLVFSRTVGIAAGTALRDSLRMAFTYKGAFFFKMQAGMGDTIFGPLYEVLKARGVKFRFFHSVKALHLSADQKNVETIDVGVQATTVSGGEYKPLVDVKGLPCWPSDPDLSQLVEGPAIQASGVDLESFWYRSTWPDVATTTLQRGADFDRVILGISIGAFPDLCSELIAASTPFKEMVDHVPTVRTQAMQLWFDRDLAGLGWALPSPVLGTYAKPFDTWADMTHLIAREDFPAASEPKNLAYFCGWLDDPAGPWTPASEKARVKTHALAWLKDYTRPLFPAASVPGTNALDWSVLSDPSGGVGVARFDAQYHRANVNPSDRYVVTPRGSTQYRLRADESGFDNLVLAGDWVKTGIDGGCVEAAVMAGLQASRAICGRPATIVGDE